MDKKEKLWDLFFENQNKELFPHALEILLQIKVLEPQNPMVFLKMGDVYQKMTDTGQAVSSYIAAAGILEEQGFKSKAVALYKMVLRIAPDNDFAVCKINEALQEEKNAALKKKAVKSAPPVEISLFASLPPSEMAELNSQIERHIYKPGGIVVNEGDTGKSLYVIKKGSLKVSTGVLGKTIDIGMLSEGDVFGEIAFLTGRPRTASVTASTDSEVIEIKEEVLQELIRKHPEINNILRTFYESRVHDTVQKIKVELTPLEAA